MTLVFKKPNGDQVVIGASKSASRFKATGAPLHLDIEFGAKTVAGNAGADIGPAGTTISSGDASGHFQVNDVGGRAYISPSVAGDTADLSGSPYSLVLSSGYTATVTAIANATTVDSLTEMETILESSATAFGDRVYLREGGSYGAQVTVTVPTYTGTWTAPSNRSPYQNGIDLDTGNYVRVMAHTGESPVVAKQVLLQSANANAYLRFSGITFNVTDPGQATALAVGMLEIQGLSWVAIDNCTFQALNSTDYGDTERRQGVYLKARNSNPCNDITIQDCTFNDCWEAIRSGTGNARMTMVGNTIRRAWDDCVEIDASSGMRICWNFLIDKLHPDGGSGAHGDFFQIGGIISASCDDLWMIGNVMARGAGRSGFNDGQGIFVNDFGSTFYPYNRPVIVGNRTCVGFTNHINISSVATITSNQTVDAFIRSNTCIIDGVNRSNTPTIQIDTPNSNLDRNYNLLTRDDAASGTDIHVTRTTGIDATFVGGQSGTTDSAVGSTLAEVVTSTNIVASSSPDTASPKVGAHQDYIDYVNRALSLPYSLPTAPA